MVGDVAGPRPEWRKSPAFNLTSIRWKILVIALIAAVAFTAYLGFNLVQLNSQAVLLEEIRIKRYPLQSKLQEALFALRFIQAKMQDAVLTGEIESLEEVVELREQFLTSIRAVEEIDPAKMDTAEKIVASFNNYYVSSYQLARDLIKGDGDFISGAVRGEENAALYTQVVISLDRFKAQELRSFTDAVNHVTDRANSIIEIGVSVGLVTVLLLFALALLTSRWIIARINHIVNTLRTIAHEDGDMSVRIPVDGHDEMAELSFWFNRFIAKLERITNESTREIKRLAYTDSLTNLPNRRLFNKHLAGEIKRCERMCTSLAVMFLDLDNFKLVNDQLGHDAGDALVCEVARRLEKTLRGFDLVAWDFESGVDEGEDMVARMGGDEFMLIVSDLDNPTRAASIAERVRQVVLDPIDLLGNGIEIGVSIGIAVFPDNGTSAEELTVNADLAMYEAKNRGKNNFCFFSSELEEAARLDAETETALRSAINDDELELYYQPKLDIGSGAIIGAEALLRWHHPMLGSVSPARFVPLAESSDLIYDLDHWVMRAACAQIKAWCDAGIPTVPVAINISAKQAARQDLPGKLEAAIETCGLLASSLEVEITETSALADMETVAANIQLLKELGVTVALDDFGAGYSSLSLLKYCSIDTLKIDRGFISELNQGSSHNSIINGVIAMAKVLQVTVVAEGVEEREQFVELKRMGCHYAQGFLFARPMPAIEFEKFLHNQATMEKVVG